MKKKTENDGIFIPRKILKINKLTMERRAILSYFLFRIQLKDINWTFSQADISKFLNVSKSVSSRYFQDLLIAKVLKYVGSETINGHIMKKFQLNIDEFHNYLNSVELPGATDELPGATDELLETTDELLETTDELSTATYNTDNKKEEKERNIKQNNNTNIENFKTNIEKEKEFDNIFGDTYYKTEQDKQQEQQELLKLEQSIEFIKKGGYIN